MTTIKKVLCLALSSLMLLSVLVSCRQDEPPASDNTSGDVVDSATGETEETWATDANGYVLDSIEDVDLGGKEIRILMGSNRKRECFIEDDDIGTPVNSAIFTRNQTVQVRLNCKLNFIEEKDGWESQATYTETAINMSTANEVDLFTVYSLTANTLMINGVLTDILANDIIEFDKPYWNSKMVESCSLYDKMYFCTGEISYTLIDCIYVMLFNKELAADMGMPRYLSETYGIDSLYDLVESGEWTLDNMMKIAKQFSVDSDGVKNAEDTFGYVASSVSIDSYWGASNLTHLSKGNDGSIVICDDMSSKKASDLAAKVVEFMKSPAVMVQGSFAKVEKDPAPATFWDKGQAVFYHISLNELMRDTGFEMGVLPIPKYDEDQEEYLTCPGFGYGMWGIARSAENYEDLCYVMECMASESYRKVIPVYFDQMLLNRQDAVDDYKVLQTLRESIVVDGGRVMDKVFNSTSWGVFRGAVLNGVDYLGYYQQFDTPLKEQAVSLNSLVLNMEQIYS